MFHKVKSDEFYTRFRQLCKEYAKGFPCENLAFCVREFQDVLSANREGINDLVVMQIFQVFLDEFQNECVRRIEEISKYCPR